MIGIEPEEIQALCSLLDDPDPAVQRAVRGRFSELGPSSAPFLRAALERLEGETAEEWVRLLHEWEEEGLLGDWTELLERPEPDLEEGAFLLARWRDRDLDVAAYVRILDEMADQARESVSSAVEYERGLVLARFLCERWGFRGNAEDYYNPDNSFLNRVIESRKGIPISLSLVFILVGRRLGLPVAGVDMPVHFLARYGDESEGVLVDMYHGGVAVSRSDAIRFLLRAGITPAADHFAPASSRTVLLRMVRNLVAVGLRDPNHADLRVLERWLR